MPSSQTNMTKLISPYFLCTFCINHQPISPATKTIKAHVCSATNPTTFPRKFRMAPTTLPMMGGNASAAFPASLLKASASLSNHFFKVPLSFDGEPHVPLPPPETPVMARTIAAMVMDREASTEAMVIPCSLNRIRILSAKDASLSRTFSSVCLILAICVWRSFQFCDIISSLACFFGIQII